MMKRKAIALFGFLLLAMILALFSGCNEENSSREDPASEAESSGGTISDQTLPAGLNFPVDDLMDPAFFDQDASVFKKYYYRPSGAEFIHDGIQEEIPADDPRLNRLMNMIEYCMNESTIWRQGVVPDEEAEEWFHLPYPILVLHFPKGNNAPDRVPVEQIVVCGAEYLLYYPDSDGSKMYIEEYWPSAGYLFDLYYKAAEITSEEYNNYLKHAKESPWFDVLTYCGFGQ